MAIDEYTPPTERELLEEIHDAIMHPTVMFPGVRNPTPGYGPFVKGYRASAPLRLCANQTMGWKIEVEAIEIDRIKFSFQDPFGSISRSFEMQVFQEL